MIHRKKLLSASVLMAATLLCCQLLHASEKPPHKTPSMKTSKLRLREQQRAAKFSIARMKKERVELEKLIHDSAPEPDKVALGKLLFFDKILSGNKNISCATCHHALADTGDGLSLPVGEGGRGLGISRGTGTGENAIHERVPRNAQHLFNLGLVKFGDFPRLFWDGRVAFDPTHSKGFNTPAGEDLPAGLENVLEAQALFPVTSATEMAGQAGENAVADAAAAGQLAGEGGVWDLLAKRLQQIPEYVPLFIKAFDDVSVAGDITLAHAAKAIAAYEGRFGYALNSPFDRYLLGDPRTMSAEAKRGMWLFYGKAECSSCHIGILQTNNHFHSIAMPQIGPGKGDGFDSHEDFGREQVSGDPADRYLFRTPTLRNVVLTGPWGHDGAYNSLEAMVQHLFNPAQALESYDTKQAVLPSRPDLDAIDFLVHNNPASRAAIAASSEIIQLVLKPDEISDLMAFLNALTDPSCIDLRRFAPKKVPSGLPLAD